MSTKKTTTSKTTNSLPDWLTSPYQAATTQATALSQPPAISDATQGVIDRTIADSATGSAAANTSLTNLSDIASGNFGSFADTLMKAANGDYLTADTNPYIKGVADQGADAAMARINSQFGAAGRSNGSGLYAELFSKGISDAANTVYANNYENERNRQQAAAGGLLNTQLAASGQIPALISGGIAANQAGLSAGNYRDTAGMEKLRQYTSILSALAAPYAVQDSKTTTKSSGLGSALGTIASLGSAIAAPFTGGASLLGGLAGGASSAIINPAAMSGIATGALPSWLGKAA